GGGGGGARAGVFIAGRGPDAPTAALSLPGRLDALKQVLARSEARLLVIDPVMTFFGPGVNTGNDRSVRRALEPLSALARLCGCAVLLIRHLTKKGGERALYRGLGSIGLVGLCRSAWLVAEEAEGSPRRVLAQVKNNLAAPQPSLAFEVAQPAGGPPTLTALGPVALTGDGLLARRHPRRPGPEPQALEVALAFLAEVLAGGPRPVNDVWARAQPVGLSEITLRRAKRELGVRSVWVKEDGR